MASGEPGTDGLVTPDFSSTETRVLLAVVNGARTYEELMAATGVSRGHLHWVLSRLRAGGLVDWRDRHYGTLVPLVGAVPWG